MRALPDPRHHLLPFQEGFVATGAVVVGRVTLRQDASVWYGAVLRGDDDEIVLGARSNVQDNAVLHPMIGIPLHVGEDVTIGHGAIVHLRSIGDRCLVGMGSILLAGAEIGEECIVAAGALVREGVKIPPRSLVVGSPARIARAVRDQDLDQILFGAREYVAKTRLHLGPGAPDGGPSV